MRFLATALLTLATPALSQRLVEVAQPNDTPAQAQALPIGRQMDGAIDLPGDVDFYSFTLGGTADLRVWTGPGFGNQVGDTVLSLHDVTGRQLFLVDDGSAATHGFYSLLNVGSLAAGTYYLKVAGGFGSPTGTYTLDLIDAPAGTYVTSVPLTQRFETPEENDPRVPGVASRSSVDSRNLGAIAANRGGGGTAWNAAFVGAQDYDFYSFTMAAGGVVTLKTLPGQGATSVADTVLHLVDATTMRRIGFNDDGGAVSRFSCLVEYCPAGTYYAVVNSFAAGDTGGYILDIELSHLVPPSVQAQATVRSGGCSSPAFPQYLPHLSTRDAAFFPGVSPEQPLLGSTFVLDVTGVPPNAQLSIVLDVQSVTPLNLSNQGAPGCHAELDPQTGVLNMQQSSATGDYFWVLPMPLDPTLAGLPLELQIAVVGAYLNPGGFLVSNRVSLTCGIGH